MPSLSTLGLLVGLVLGVVAVFGGLGEMLVVALLGALGLVVGRALDGTLDLTALGARADDVLRRR